MKLNKWQALDILEKFNFFQGQRAGRELWSEKPSDVQEQDIANFSRDIALLKNYINELTAENETLKRALGGDMVVTRSGRCSGKTQHLNAVIRIKKDAIVADTVRKMQEALEQRIHSKLSYHGWYLKETVIAEIAKEIIEGENKNDE